MKDCISFLTAKWRVSYLASQNTIVSNNFRKENKRLKSNEKQTKHTSFALHFSKNVDVPQWKRLPDVPFIEMYVFHLNWKFLFEALSRTEPNVEMSYNMACVIIRILSA